MKKRFQVVAVGPRRCVPVVIAMTWTRKAALREAARYPSDTGVWAFKVERAA